MWSAVPSAQEQAMVRRGIRASEVNRWLGGARGGRLEALGGGEVPEANEKVKKYTIHDIYIYMCIYTQSTPMDGLATLS